MTRSPRLAAALALVPGLLALAPLAHADDASKRTKVQELFVVMKVDNITTQIVNSIMQQTQALEQRQFGPNPTPEQQKQYEDFRGKIQTLVTDNVGWKVMQPEFVTLYSNTYTEPEIDGILTFYKSPTGQAMLNKAPELAQKSTGLAQQHMQSIQPQLRELVQNFVNQTKPAGSTAPGSTAPGAPPSTPQSSTPPATRPAPSLSQPQQH